jgi:hypothetical protein
MGTIHIENEKLMYDNKEVMFYGDKKTTPKRLRKPFLEGVAYAILRYSLIEGFIVVDEETIDVVPEMFEREDDDEI